MFDGFEEGKMDGDVFGALVGMDVWSFRSDFDDGLDDDFADGSNVGSTDGDSVMLHSKQATGHLSFTLSQNFDLLISFVKL